MIEKQSYYSTVEAARILGTSRITVFNRIKGGQINAKKIGRNYAISATEVAKLTSQKELADNSKAQLDRSVRRVVKEYGETLKLLSNG